MGLVKTNLPLKNHSINGNFDIWQRGVLFTSPNGVYTSDRWRVENAIDTNVTISQSSTIYNNIGTYSYRAQANATGGSGAFSDIKQIIEDRNYKYLLGKQITLSCWVKLDAAVSALTHSLFITQTSGGTSVSTVNTTNWQFLSVTTVLSPSTTTLTILLRFNRNGVTSGNGINISQVMLNEGPAAAPFKLFGEDIEGELAACQRYYQILGFGALFPTSGNNSVPISYMTEMRAVPSFITSLASGTFSSGTTLYENPTIRNFRLTCASGSSGAVLTSGTIPVDAEL